ncbi:MAG: hypothetical protein IJ421_08515 [Prevotella sp.]|nr:hypothetical protein [Prevotella sp.]MBQ8629500.1 hypothetical protein [Prevotella sp.]
MKHLFLVLITLISLTYPFEATGSEVETVFADNYVVFRTTQKLRANDGREIYLYSNRICELYEGDRLVVKCTYRLQEGEVRLLDEYGNTVYKGTYRMTSDRRNVVSLRLGDTTYYKK